MTSPYRLPWLEQVDGAAWIAQSLGREAGLVRSLVPPVFPSYLRVTVRAEHSAGENPDPLLRDGLISTIRRGEVEADRCTFGVSDVYGWNGGESSAVPLVADGSLSRDVDPDSLLRGLHDKPSPPKREVPPYPHPKLVTALRDYMLYSGSVEDSARVVDADGPRWLPDLWWPDDRSWFVATDTDLTFAVVAGPHSLIDSIAMTSDFHSEIVGPDSSLA